MMIHRAVTESGVHPLISIRPSIRTRMISVSLCTTPTGLARTDASASRGAWRQPVGLVAQQRKQKRLQTPSMCPHFTPKIIPCRMRRRGAATSSREVMRVSF
eukprot:scaffold52700_cov31-Tisochrysis_lutea.AAC.4